MRCRSIPPGTLINSDAARVTLSGLGSLIGTVVCCVSHPPTEETYITDGFSLTPRYILLPPGIQPGVYVFPLNAESSQTNWRISTPLGVSATTTGS